MYDISAANLVEVVLSVGTGGIGSDIRFKKEDFSADASPVRIDGGAVVQTKIDMRKRLVPSRSYHVVRVVLTPIPNTDTDNRLKALTLKARSTSADKKAGAVNLMTIRYASVEDDSGLGGGKSENTITLSDGYVVDGNMGIEVLSDGRYGSQSYAFEFANISGDYKVASSWVQMGDGTEGDSSGGNMPRKERRPPKYTINPKKTGGIFYFGQDASGRESRGFIYRGA